MIKQIVLIGAGGSAAQRVMRAALVRTLPGMERYLYNDLIDEVRRDHLPSAGLQLAGIEELWFADPLAARSAQAVLLSMSSPAIRAQLLTVDEHLIFERSMDGGAALKRISLLRRRAGMTPESFCQYWRSVHAPLAECHRFVNRYVQNHVLHQVASHPAADNDAVAAVDGVAEFQLTDLVRMQEDYASPEGQRMKADVARFADAVTTYLVRPVS